MHTCIKYNGGLITAIYLGHGDLIYTVESLGDFETIEEAKAAIDGMDQGFDLAAKSGPEHDPYLPDTVQEYVDTYEPTLEELCEELEVV